MTHQTQAERLAFHDPQRLLKHRLQVDVLDKMRRIYAVAENMAISELPQTIRRESWRYSILMVLEISTECNWSTIEPNLFFEFFDIS